MRRKNGRISRILSASVPTPIPSSDLRIADLPEDVREDGERLKATYHALAADAGLLTEDGAMDLGKLGDLDTVKALNLETLRGIHAAAERLADLGSPARLEHRALQEPFRKDCRLKEFRSSIFSDIAFHHRFWPFQWAQVRMVERQSRGFITSAVFTAQGPRALAVTGDLDLGRCTALRALPADLSVAGDLNLLACTSLATLPPGLTVSGELDLSRCTFTTLPADLRVNGALFCTSAQIAAEAQRLKATGQILGAITLL